MTTQKIIDNAVSCKSVFAATTSRQRNNALVCMAESLVEKCDEIIEANKIDLENAKGKISEVMLDRLSLTKERIVAMAEAVKEVTNLPDPLGREIEKTNRPNGLEITKVSVPLGVLGMIFESRPNVTSDAAALSIKAGNVCVLRGGKEAINSNMAIANALRCGLEKSGLPKRNTDGCSHSS